MKTVLIIDEDDESRRFIKKLLMPDGWDIVEAKDGASALALAKSHRPQVVLLDLLMQGSSGLQLCRTLRQHSALQEAKIITTSARNYPADRQAAQEAGAQHFLVKPVDPIGLKKAMSPALPADPASGGDGGKAGAAFEEEPTRLRFWGVRGSIPSPGPETVRYGGNTSCVEVRAEGEVVILDAGSGIRPMGLALAKEFKSQPLELTLLITHTHWDHIQGFPFFVPAYNPKNTVRVLGYEGASRSLQETLSGQMESPYFPIGLKEMPGNIIFTELRNLNFEIGKVRVQATYVNHPGVCVGYRLFTRGGSITYIPDNEQYTRLKSGSAASTPESVEYARQQDQKLVDFIMNSDVLIVDSQYDAQEYAAHVGWGHSCVDDSVTLAIRAGVKYLYLFHHDPTHDDAKIASMVKHARALAAEQGGNLQIDAAREGLEVVLRQTVRKRGHRARGAD